MKKTMHNILRLSNGTAAQWEAKNPVLARGEVGVVVDDNPANMGLKIGNGITPWNGLPFLKFSGTEGKVSQTLTWADGTYTKSNVTTGIIPQSFIDTVAAAGATFNATSGYFELNGLTDISYNEMLAIYNHGVLRKALGERFLYDGADIRTNLPTNITAVDTLLEFAKGNEVVEVIAFNPDAELAVSSSGLTSLLADGCSHLKKILGVINVGSVTNTNTTVINSCPLLTDVSIKGIHQNTTIDAASISATSVAYMIANSTATSDITITLNATAYAAVSENAAVAAALAEKTYVTLAAAS